MQAILEVQSVSKSPKNNNSPLPLSFDYALYQPIQGAQLNGSVQRVFASDSRIKFGPSKWATLEDERTNGSIVWATENVEKDTINLKAATIDFSFEGLSQCIPRLHGLTCFSGDVLLMYGFSPKGKGKAVDAEYTIDGGQPAKFNLPGSLGDKRSYGHVFVNLTGLAATNHTLSVKHPSSDPKDGKVPLTLEYFEVRGTIAAPQTNANDSQSPFASGQPEDNNKSRGPNVGILIGGTLAGLVVIGMVVMAAVALRNRRRAKNDKGGIGLKMADQFISRGYKQVPGNESHAW